MLKNSIVGKLVNPQIVSPFKFEIGRNLFLFGRHSRILGRPTRYRVSVDSQLSRCCRQRRIEHVSVVFLLTATAAAAVKRLKFVRNNIATTDYFYFCGDTHVLIFYHVNIVLVSGVYRIFKFVYLVS